MSTSATNNSPKVFRIVSIGNCQAVMGHTNTINQLAEPKTNKLITKIYPSSMYTIYRDDEFSNILVAGDNRYGQLGINTNREDTSTLTPLIFFK